MLDGSGSHHLCRTDWVTSPNMQAGTRCSSNSLCSWSRSSHPHEASRDKEEEVFDLIRNPPSTAASIETQQWWGPHRCSTRTELTVYSLVTMVTSRETACKWCWSRLCFDFLLSANLHQYYSYQMCESERQAWIQPVVISFPIRIVKQLNLKTAKLRVSYCAFSGAAICMELFWQRSLLGPSLLLPSLWIFHLRWCLIWLFLSSWISSPWRSQVVISRAGPPPSSPPQALWCLIQGQGRLARHSVQTLAPFPQRTMYSSSLLWGLEEITQPREL